MKDFWRGVGLLLLWTVTALVVGFTLLFFYTWFAVPLGAPRLTVWHIMGLRMLVTLPFLDLYVGQAALRTENRSPGWMKYCTTMLVCGMVLLIGFILHLLVVYT